MDIYDDDISNIMQEFGITKRAAKIKYIIDNGLLKIEDDKFIYRGKCLKGYINNDGYKTYSPLRCNSPIHKFIAYMKFGIAALLPGVVTRHRDDNMYHNDFDNIIIGTTLDNWYDMSLEKRTEILRKTNAKLTFEVRSRIALKRESNKSPETKRQEAIKSWQTRRRNNGQ